METTYLAHHGVKGQRWGVRRYQNANGSLNSIGKQRVREYKQKMAYRKAVKDKKSGKEVKDFTNLRKQQLMTAAGKYFLNENSRMRANANVEKGGSLIFNYGRAWLGTQLKDALASTAVATGAYMITGNEGLARRYGEATMGAIKVARIGKAIGQYVPQKHSDAYSEKLSKAKMYIRDVDSKTTKRVKSDFNNLSDQAFMKKYSASKETYSKRVDKYGDPYMDSPMAKMGKKLNKK